jgi:hypothetical protein
MALKTLFALLVGCSLLPAQTVIKGGTAVAGGNMLGPVALAPVFLSLAAGTYTGSQTLSLTSSISGATIFYTTDGSTPTVASKRYTGPITVSSSETLKAIAAVVYIDGENQNQMTHIGSGTFHWKTWCYLPGCNPGGTGTPQSVTQLFNVTSPVMSGAGNSMELTETSSATANNTNVLMTDILSDCTSSCTQWMHDFYVYFDCSTFANLSQSEHDQFWFDNADGIRYMYGMQWNKATNVWQLVGNSNVNWTNTTVTQSMSCGTWNHVQLLTRRIPSELTSKPCVDKNGQHWPCLYYDQLNINETVHQLNLAFAANANPTGWTGEGMQHQINETAKNVTDIEYYSQDTFLATGDASALVSATFVIQ